MGKTEETDNHQGRFRQRFGEAGYTAKATAARNTPFATHDDPTGRF
jgi:hypothetical protein